jgi:hypothetical protein
MTTSPKPAFSINPPAVTRAGTIKGRHTFVPTSDVAIDIETGPVGSNADDSLLDPLTSKVIAIGYYDKAENIFTLATPDLPEGELLRQFWRVFSEVHASGGKMLGFNIVGFDLPFLVRRSWHHGIPVPRTLMTGGKYWSDTVVDLMAVWKFGGYRDFICLDALAKFLGVGAKNGNGAQFHQVWASDKKAALDYLKNDVQLVVECAQKMGLMK